MKTHPLAPLPPVGPERDRLIYELIKGGRSVFDPIRHEWRMAGEGDWEGQTAAIPPYSSDVAQAITLMEAWQDTTDKLSQLAFYRSGGLYHVWLYELSVYDSASDLPDAITAAILKVEGACE